jgi:hypothetical protein
MQRLIQRRNNLKEKKQYVCVHDILREPVSNWQYPVHFDLLRNKQKLPDPTRPGSPKLAAAVYFVMLCRWLNRFIAFLPLNFFYHSAKI